MAYNIKPEWFDQTTSNYLYYNTSGSITPFKHPIKVHWKGFTSDTVRLERCGWKFAVEKDFYANCYRLLGTHKDAEMYAYFDPIKMESIIEQRFPIAVGIKYITNDIKMPLKQLLEFEPVSMIDNMIFEREEYASVHQYRHQLFPIKYEPETEEGETQIIVPKKESVQDLLNMILKEQAPVQTEIRKRKINRDKQITRHASIITEVKAA